MTEIDKKELHAELERLREYVGNDCRCPCCNSTDVCVSWCTFADDCPDGWERMQAARKAMERYSFKGERL